MLGLNTDIECHEWHPLSTWCKQILLFSTKGLGVAKEQHKPSSFTLEQ